MHGRYAVCIVYLFWRKSEMQLDVKMPKTMSFNFDMPKIPVRMPVRMPWHRRSIWDRAMDTFDDFSFTGWTGYAPRTPWRRQDETTDSLFVDSALLALRVGTGVLLAGHGAQKLFGWFGGHGLKGTGGWLESMGLRPGPLWAVAAGSGEMGGGLLTALGLANPLGPIGVISAMTMATAKAHWGKPIWVTEGGAELPVVYSTVAATIALAGPGKFSLDHALGIKVPWWAMAAAGIMAGATVGYGIMAKAPQQMAQQEPEQPADAVEEEMPAMPEPVQIGERREQRRAA
jgi:putative oxidoreductase